MSENVYICLLNLGLFVEPGVLGDLHGWFFFDNFNLGFLSLTKQDRVSSIYKTLTFENLGSLSVEILWRMSIVILNRINNISELLSVLLCL